MRARLARYSLWQLRDFVSERGLPTLVVAALMLFPLVAGLRDRAPLMGADERALSARAGLATVLGGPLGFVIVLLAVNGIVSTDRKQGYYRFLFAKPLSIPRYYAQTFVVNWLGAVAATAAVVAGFAAVVEPVFPAGALAFGALYYLALGGIIFVVSTVTRLDWVVTAAVWALGQAVRAVFPPDQSWYGRLADAALPPSHRAAAVGRALVFGDSPLVEAMSGALSEVPLRVGDPAFRASVLWLAAWGAAAFLAGLVVLRKRSMGT